MGDSCWECDAAEGPRHAEVEREEPKVIPGCSCEGPSGGIIFYIQRSISIRFLDNYKLWTYVVFVISPDLYMTGVG